MNTYQKRYIRNWFIAISTIAFIAINVWALIAGVAAVKIVWKGILIILCGLCLAACVYYFIAEQIYNFRLRGVCENDNELNFLKMYGWFFHHGKFTEDDFKKHDRELIEKFLSVKRPKWY